MTNRHKHSAVIALTSVFITCAADADEPIRNIQVGDVVREIGAITSHESLSGISQNISSIPFSWTQNQSDRTDFRFEASITAARASSAGSESIIVAPGITYFLDNHTSLTSFIRLGHERFGGSNQSNVLVGGDVLIEKVSLVSQHENEQINFAEASYFIWSGKFGTAHRFAIDANTPNQKTEVWSALGKIAYDWHVDGAILAGLGGTYRARTSLASEVFAGDGQALNSLFTAAIALRKVDEVTGGNAGQIELSFTTSESDYKRISLGFTRNF